MGIGPLRPFGGAGYVGSVLIERQWTDEARHPLKVMLEVLERGESLILFLEGTRNFTPEQLLLPHTPPGAPPAPDGWVRPDGFINYVNNPRYVECSDGSTSQVGSCPAAIVSRFPAGWHDSCF